MNINEQVRAKNQWQKLAFNIAFAELSLIQTKSIYSIKELTDNSMPVIRFVKTNMIKNAVMYPIKILKKSSKFNL